MDPLTRHNPGNNTGKGVPNIEYKYVPGQDYVDFIISFKGCGAELGNAMKIFTTATLKLDKDFEGLKRFVLETAVNAGGKPCPPFGIGIGIGGQMDIAGKLSREAISTRKWNDTNPDPMLARLEEELRGHRMPGGENQHRRHPYRHRPGLRQLPLLGGPPGRRAHL